jgi:hypothetical protein
MRANELVEQYYAVASEGTTLHAFIQIILHDCHTREDRDAMLEFVDQVERIVLSNMITHGDDDNLEEAEEEFHAIRNWLMDALPM